MNVNVPFLSSLASRYKDEHFPDLRIPATFQSACIEIYEEYYLSIFVQFLRGVKGDRSFFRPLLPVEGFIVRELSQMTDDSLAELSNGIVLPKNFQKNFSVDKVLYGAIILFSKIEWNFILEMLVLSIFHSSSSSGALARTYIDYCRDPEPVLTAIDFEQLRQTNVLTFRGVDFYSGSIEKKIVEEISARLVIRYNQRL